MSEIQRSLENIGWIGLGKMGHPMAINLIKAGKKVSVFNRTAEKTMDHVSLGGTAINSIKELASSSDVIFTMISDDKAFEEIALPKLVLSSDEKKCFSSNIPLGV